jgi:hypothetical protein
MHRAWIRTAKFLGLPLLGFALLEANAVFPLIRFVTSLANLSVAFVSYMLPIVTLIFALIVPRYTITKLIVALLLLPILAVCAFGCLVSGLRAMNVYGSGMDGRFKPIALAPMDGYAVRLYVTSFGSIDTPAVVVRQEKQILPGILLVRNLWEFDPADVATCAPIGRNAVRVQIPEAKVDYEGTIPAQSKIIHLKPYLYF